MRAICIASPKLAGWISKPLDCFCFPAGWLLGCSLFVSGPTPSVTFWTAEKLIRTFCVACGGPQRTRNKEHRLSCIVIIVYLTKRTLFGSGCLWKKGMSILSRSVYVYDDIGDWCRCIHVTSTAILDKMGARALHHHLVSKMVLVVLWCVFDCEPM